MQALDRLNSLKGVQREYALSFIKHHQNEHDVSALQEYLECGDMMQIAVERGIDKTSVYNYVRTAIQKIEKYIKEKNGSYICKTCVLKLNGEIPVEATSTKIGRCPLCEKGALLVRREDAGIKEKKSGSRITAYSI